MWGRHHHPDIGRSRRLAHGRSEGIRHDFAGQITTGDHPEARPQMPQRPHNRRNLHQMTVAVRGYVNNKRHISQVDTIQRGSEASTSFFGSLFLNPHAGR
jgi:hypothetical protein